MKRKEKRRLSRLLQILLFSFLTAAFLHGFRMITILWTTQVFQEAFQLCPKISHQTGGILSSDAITVHDLENGIVKTIRE